MNRFSDSQAVDLDGERLTALPASMMGRCEKCDVRGPRAQMRQLGDKVLCPDCFRRMMAEAESAMRAMKVESNEPERRCSRCRAMVDPGVSSAWCPVLELGDARALLCDRFQPLAVAGEDMLSGPQTRSTTARKLWSLVCAELDESLGPTHLAWLQRIRPSGLEDRVLYLEVEDEYTRSWLMARLMPAISRCLELNGHPDVVIELKTAGSKSAMPETIDEEPSPPTPPLSFPPPAVLSPSQSRDSASGQAKGPAVFGPAFGFDQFVVGAGNRLAHAGAMAVTEHPSSYNPLFIHGGVGVGKTHLLQAIGGRCAERGRQAMYTTSEAFTNDLIAAIRAGATVEFRRRYREIDVLLVDDIQFIIGKDSTQEEFFHTFNWLRDAGKQIVLSSDRPPYEMRVLDERLRSRFSWGLLADIEPPDLETRIEILRRKSRRRGYMLAEDVVVHLASQAPSNVRELEGLLNRLLALAQLHRVEPSLALALNLYSERRRRREVNADDILRAVCAYFRLTSPQLTGRGRGRSMSTARHIAMYLMREDAKLSLTQIGERLAGRDHTTVLYGCQRVLKETTGKSTISSDVEAIRSLLAETAVA